MRKKTNLTFILKGCRVFVINTNHGATLVACIVTWSSSGWELAKGATWDVKWVCIAFWANWAYIYIYLYLYMDMYIYAYTCIYTYVYMRGYFCTRDSRAQNTGSVRTTLFRKHIQNADRWRDCCPNGIRTQFWKAIPEHCSRKTMETHGLPESSWSNSNKTFVCV